MKKKPKNKRYIVFLNMRWSDEVIVSAANCREAKTKGFNKLVKKLTQRDFIISAEETKK